MAQSSNGNRGNSGRRSNSRSSKSRSNDQSKMSNWGETAKDKPFTTAAAAAGAVAAGVFLWTKRSQISDQISRLSEQVTGWADDRRSGSSSGDQSSEQGTDAGTVNG